MKIPDEIILSTIINPVGNATPGGATLMEDRHVENRLIKIVEEEGWSSDMKIDFGPLVNNLKAENLWIYGQSRGGLAKKVRQVM